MGMLRTEATPRRVEGMWSEPPPELLDSFYVPTDEEKQWAKEQIKKLESHSEPSSPHPKHPRHPKYQLLNHFAPKVSRTQRLLSHYRSITSPARKVPDEVWQAIFMELFEAEDEVFQILPIYEAPPSKEPAPLNGLNSLKKEDPWNKTAYSPKSRRMQLLSICRRWRNILLGTPDVWSRVSLDCATPEKPNRVVDKKSLAYLKWVYKRSSDMPLSIDFMTTGEKYITPRLPEELVEIVQSSVPRWRSLKLLAIHADSIWFVPPPPPDENETEPKDESAEENNEDKDAPEFPLPLAIPSLDTLTLDFDDLQTNEEEAINAIPGAPTLKHLNIVNLINIWMMPKAARLFPTLNRLQSTLSFMQPAERFHTSFIHDLSNLTHFHFSGTLRWFPTQAPFPLPTVFPQIQVFSLESRKESMGYILSLFTLPNLHKLRLKIDWQPSAEFYCQGFQSNLLSFIERSQANITHVVIADFPTLALKAMLPSFSQVRNFEMFVPCLSDGRGMVGINDTLSSLTWDADRPLLPELRKMRLSFYDDGRFSQAGFFRPGGEVDVVALIDVCKSRLKNPDTEDLGAKAAILEEVYLAVADHGKLKDKEVHGLQGLRLLAKKETGRAMKVLVRQGAEVKRQIISDELVPW